MDIAGHVSKRMLKHYSHTRMEAKRRAVAALVSNENASDRNVEDAAGTEKETSKSLAKRPRKIADVG
jgi:hypothetical protein